MRLKRGRKRGHIFGKGAGDLSDSLKSEGVYEIRAEGEKKRHTIGKGKQLRKTKNLSGL